MSDELHDSEFESPAEVVEFAVEPAEAGTRLDALLAERLPDYSRTHLRKVIATDAVQLDGQCVKASTRVKPGQQVRIELPEMAREVP